MYQRLAQFNKFFGNPPEKDEPHLNQVEENHPESKEGEADAPTQNEEK